MREMSIEVKILLPWGNDLSFTQRPGGQPENIRFHPRVEEVLALPGGIPTVIFPEVQH
jgi:hypothetical protein